jgi:hypothetical protein
MTKKCTKCGEIKVIEEFYKARDMKDGRQSLCKVCKREHSRNWWHADIDKHRDDVKKWHKANREKVLNNVRQWKRNNPDKARAQHLKRKYGITEEDYQSVLVSQGGVCAICGELELSKTGRLHIDHNHDTGKVRGLLCGQCNKGIGLFKDTPDLLLSAAKYLKRHQPSITGLKGDLS